jgi:hypothetical protein
LSEFKRRPQLTGNTDSARTSQPYIVGFNQKDSNGEFPGIASLPAELRLETEASGGPVSVSFTTDTLMRTIVDDINTQMSGFAEAEDRDGVLLIRTLGSGEGAFIRVHPEILGYAAEDTTFTFGFPRYPDPKATVWSADEVQSPVRPDLQANPAGTGMIAFGEDRVGSSYNRILQILASNNDYLYTQLHRPIGVPEAIRVLDDGFWAPRLHFNSAGELDQIDLSGLGALDSRYDGRRLFIGNLSNSSSLEDIAEYFAVMDSDDKELLNGEDQVRIGAVTRGLRPGVGPSFPDGTSPPTSPLFNTAGVPADGGNALGVDRVKSVAVITDILFRSSIRCETATFISDGVAAGDKADIALADVDVPFNHNGEYYVDVVVSEEELILRPINPADRGELNPDVGGALGTVTISSTGEFERGIFVTLTPPLPRFPPEAGHLKLVLGMESTAGSLLVDTELIPTIRSAEEVDAYVLKEIQRRLTLDGVYDSMSDNRGAGFYARVDGRPFTVGLVQATRNTVPGTSDRSGTGEVLADNVLSIDSPDGFTSADIGRVAALTGAPYLEEQRFAITHVLDGGKARLAPLTSAEDANFSLPVVAVSYEIFDGSRTEAPAAFDVVGTAPGWGYAYDSRHLATGTTNPTYAQSFAHIERVKLDRPGANISRFAVTFDGTAKIGLPFDPEDTYSIWGEEESDTRGNQERIGSLLVVHNGPHAGFYRVQKTHSSSVTDDSVEVVNLDGTVPALAVVGFPVEASFYNFHFGTKVPFAGKTSGAWLFHDGVEHGDAVAEALRLGWRGNGRGLALELNDPSFVAHANGDGAIGYAIEVIGYSPADGVHVDLTADVASAAASERGVKGAFLSVLSSHHKLSVDSADAFDGWAGRFHQKGEDPGIIAIRGPESGAPFFGQFTAFPAAIVAVSKKDTQAVGRGFTAIEAYGTIYQSRAIYPEVEDPNSDAGGLYTESAAGLGRHAYPLSFRPSQGLPAGNPAPYFGTTPFTNWLEPTQLGHPGQMFPEAGGTSAATIHAPDYVTFNFSHSASVYIDGVIRKPLARYIGQNIYIESTGGLDPDGLLGRTLVIQAVKDLGEGSYVFAANVQNITATTSGGADDDYEVRIRGNRWYEGYLNIGDWALIGTRFERANRAWLPGLTLADRTIDLFDRDNAAQGLLSFLPYPPMSEGIGVGNVVDLSDLTLLGLSDYGRLDDPWQGDADEPASPFPNASFVAPLPSYANFIIGKALTRSYEGDLTTGDVRLEQLTAASPNGLVAGFAPSEGFGPALRVVPDYFQSGGFVETARVWFRGVRAFPQANGSIRVRVITESGQLDSAGNRSASTYDATKDFVVKLMDSAGNTLATSAVQTSSFFRTEREIIFDFDDLDFRHYAHLEESRMDAVGIHAVFEFDINWIDDESDRFEYMQFHRVEVDLHTRAAHLTGPLLTTGPVVAASFRHISPVRGYQPISPMDVFQMKNTEFAKDFGDNDGVGAVGGMEMHDVGLVADDSGTFHMPVYDSEIFFKKGVASAAITGRYPYYDPLWYPVIAYDGADTEVDRPSVDRYVLPGRTGFAIPLDPPHGSQLTDLHLSLSLRPKWVDQAPSTAGRWEIWHSIPNDRAPVNDTEWQEWRDPSEWDSRTGYWIRLWRQHTLDYGKMQQDRDWGGLIPGTNEPTGQTDVRPEFGWPEVIWEQQISLGSAPPDFDENPALNGDGVSREVFRHQTIDLASGIAELQKRTVDRRQYTYYATIEFWIGWRRTISNGVDPEDPVQRLEDNATHFTPFRRTVTVSARGTFNQFRSAKFQGIPTPYPLDTFTLPLDVGPFVNNRLGWPMVVKFRGGRLGWITDRPGHGGWG